MLGVSTSESGYWVNDLPGIATELVDLTTFIGDKTVQETWESIQKRAYLRLKSYIMQQYNSIAKFNKVVMSTGKIKRFNELIKINSDNGYRGVYIQTSSSNYMSVRINSISIYSDDIVNDMNIYIIDANTGVIIETLQHDIAIGLNIITINKDFISGFSTEKIAIVVDANFHTIRTGEAAYSFFNDCDVLCSCNTNVYAIKTEDLNIIDPTMSEGQGVWASIDIICSPDAFIDKHLPDLLTSILYLIGAETLKQKKGSPRLNLFTASNLAYTEELHNEFEKEWEKAAKLAINGISINGESLCFSCEDSAIVSYSGNIV